MHIQSVLIHKKLFHTRDEAKKKVIDMGYKGSIHPDPNPESKSFYRFRQRQPSQFVHGSFRTIELPNDKDIHFIIGKLKSK